MSQRTLDAVREAQGAGVEPWNTAEHDKAVHGPTPEGGTTNPMESEPPVSETYDDEGDDERDENASADDEMAFIDDAFFELPDAATEEGAEGGGSQSQYSQPTEPGGRERGEPEQPGQPTDSAPKVADKSTSRGTIHGPTPFRTPTRRRRRGRIQTPRRQQRRRRRWREEAAATMRQKKKGKVPRIAGKG